MKNAFDLTVNALREQGLNSDEILKELSKLFQKFSKSANAAEIKDPDECKIRNILKELCMPIENKGYECWIAAIRIWKKANSGISMGKIYQLVAEECRTTPAFAERAMRHAVDCASKKCDKNVLNSIFAHNISSKTGKPKNKQFLAVVAELI